MPCTVKTASSISEPLFLFSKRQLDGFSNSWIVNLSENVLEPCQRIMCSKSLKFFIYDTVVTLNIAANLSSSSAAPHLSIALCSSALPMDCQLLIKPLQRFKDLHVLTRSYEHFFYCLRFCPCFCIVPPFGWRVLRCASSDR